jgi:predicted nucleotidyltransferase
MDIASKQLSREMIISTIKRDMPYLCKEFGVENLALFGSFARDAANEDSDIDIVVTLSKPLGFGFVKLIDYLESKLHRKVDLITNTTLELGIIDPRRSHIAREIQESLVNVSS